MKFTMLAIIAMQAALCAPAFSQTLQPWTTYQGNAAHTGYVPVSLNTAEFEKAWSVTVGGEATLQPVTAADGMVYVSQMGYFSDQGLYVLKSLDGSELWNIKFPNIFSVNPPAYDNGKVYIQTGNHSGDTWLRAYEVGSGGLVFQAPHEAQWERYLAPTIVDQMVYVNGGSYGGMYSFSGVNGQQNWFAPLSQYDQWTPAVDATYAYSYVGETGLNVVKRADGQLAYTIADPNFNWNGYSMNLAPVLGTQNDVIVFNGGRLVSFDLANRKIRWTVQDGFNSQPSLTNGVVYAVNNGALSVRREDTGAAIWGWAPPSDALDGPVIVTDSHVFVSGASTTYAVDLTTRTAVWSYPQGGALALSEGTLYIAGSNGLLTAIAVGDQTVGGANLRLSLKSEWIASEASGHFAYRARISNQGPSNATSVNLSIRVPRGLGVSQLDRACRFARQVINCRYNSLAADQAQTATFNLVPARAGAFTVAGKVSATQLDPVLRNNHDVSQVIAP
jgi:hypothetical protein